MFLTINADRGKSINTDIEVTRSGAVSILTFSRVHVRNALTCEMRDWLIEWFESAKHDESIRGIVVTGSGDKAFSAGQDLKEARLIRAEQAEQWIRGWGKLYDQLLGYPKPIVAAVNGVALGAGLQIALLCDQRIGHEKVRLGLPEINSGIVSAYGTWIIRELFGNARAMDLSLTGRAIDAQECLSIGLLHRLVPQKDVLSEAINMANELAEKSPVSFGLLKRQFRGHMEDGLRNSIEAGLKGYREKTSKDTLFVK